MVRAMLADVFILIEANDSDHQNEAGGDTDGWEMSLVKGSTRAVGCHPEGPRDRWGPRGWEWGHGQDHILVFPSR